MNTNTLILVAFAVLGVVSLLVFFYCAWADRHDKNSENRKN